jgi:hypothetical protein
MYIIQFDCGAAPPPALLYMPMATDLLELVYIMCIHLVIALYMSSKSFIMPDNLQSRLSNPLQLINCTIHSGAHKLLVMSVHECTLPRLVYIIIQIHIESIIQKYYCDLHIL